MDNGVKLRRQKTEPSKSYEKLPEQFPWITVTPNTKAYKILLNIKNFYFFFTEVWAIFLRY